MSNISICSKLENILDAEIRLAKQIIDQAILGTIDLPVNATLILKLSCATDLTEFRELGCICIEPPRKDN
jgi:hypothetical protein